MEKGNFEHADEVDPERIEQAAEVAVLVIDETLPIGLGHLAHRNRFVVRVGDVIAEIDGRAGVIDVAQAIEARIEGADEIALRVIDRGRKPALGVVAQRRAET